MTPQLLVTLLDALLADVEPDRYAFKIHLGPTQMEAFQRLCQLMPEVAASKSSLSGEYRGTEVGVYNFTAEAIVVSTRAH